MRLRRRRSDSGAPPAAVVPELLDRGAESGDPRPPVSLTRTAARGFVWSFGGGVVLAALGIANLVILARLLTPAEFGAAAAASLVVGFATLFSQLGVASALVQRKDLRDDEVSSALVCSVLLSSSLALLLFLLTPLLNLVVGLPSENDLLRLLSLSLLMAGLAAVPAGLLQRRLRFRAIAIVDVLASGFGSIGVSIVLALLGFGAYSLVWGSVAAGVISAVGYGALARPAVRVAAPRQIWRDVQPLVRFGSGQSLASLGNWLALNADNLVTTNLLGPAALGVYSRAYRLLSQPANLIGGAADKVLFPAMSQVRDDRTRLGNAYLRSTSLVAMVAVPVSVLLVVLAPEIVYVLLGAAWTEVILPLQVLAAVLVPRASYRISSSLTRATGRVYAGAWRQWLYAAEVLLFCAVGARWGVTGIAVGASVAIVIHFLTMLHFSARVLPGLVRSVLGLYLRKHVPLAVVVAGVTAPLATVLRDSASEFVTLVVAGGAGGVGALVTVGLLRRYFTQELEVLATILRRKGGGAGRPSTGTVATREGSPAA